MLLVIILPISGAKAIKSANRCSWPSFCQLLEPKLESLQIDGPGYHFVDLWSQGKKVFKLMLVAIILSTYFWCQARKSSNRCSWPPFCRLLEPRPESLQIDAPGNHFVDFWSQGRKVFKSMLLAITL